MINPLVHYPISELRFTTINPSKLVPSSLPCFRHINLKPAAMVPALEDSPTPAHTIPTQAYIFSQKFCLLTPQSLCTIPISLKNGPTFPLSPLQLLPLVSNIE